mmetsp:Transcript_73126/g.122092  ORF Transcript_73126/g.122092 Transcript_73126/m.122092 type:complete len:662 (-) Transcript_73126:95-2080(-)
MRNVLFHEDFSRGIRHDRWKHDVSAHGGGNNEFQVYTAHSRNSYVSNGTLFLKPSFTYNQFGDLRGDLDLYALGCTNDWNHGCRRQGTLHAEGGNAGGKYWTSQDLTLEDMPDLRAHVAAAGKPACEERDGVCNTMVPVGGLRGVPVMSAKLTSHFRFKYGRVEFEATLPRGDYLWPALWMLPASASPWPTAGEIDVMESMGNRPGRDFALDYQSTSAAIHFGKQSSWYDLAYTPMFEELLGQPFGSIAGRRKLSGGPHIFGCYWAADNLYMYIDDDTNRVLDMDQVFRLKAAAVLQHPRADITGPVPPHERQAIAVEIAEHGYRCGWRKYVRMNNRLVPEWLWLSDGAPFDQPFYLIMNLAVGGDFFKSNFNPESEEQAMFDVPLSRSGQLPAMYWYSRMKSWWSSWSKPDATPLPQSFAGADSSPSAFLETRNTWREYANGGQDAGRPSNHLADTLANVSPPPDEDIDDATALQVHRVTVFAVEGSEVCSDLFDEKCQPVSMAAQERENGGNETCVSVSKADNDEQTDTGVLPRASSDVRVGAVQKQSSSTPATAAEGVPRCLLKDARCPHCHTPCGKEAAFYCLSGLAKSGCARVPFSVGDCSQQCHLDGSFECSARSRKLDADALTSMLCEDQAVHDLARTPDRRNSIIGDALHSPP